MFLIPIVSAFCFRSGGVGRDDRFLPFMNPPTWWANKWWRWGIGLPIAVIIGACNDKISVDLLWLVPAYFVVTNCFPYGEKSWLNFLGKDLKWLTYGTLFGACSLLALPFGYGMTQILLAGFSFWGLMKLSNDGIPAGWYGEWQNDGYWKKRVWYLDHAIVEVVFGFLGTAMYVYK